MVFRIDGPKPVAPAAAARRAQTAAPGFTVPSEPAARPQATAATAAAPGLAAMLALQGVNPQAEARARQVARGRRALDGLEALQRAILLGEAADAAEQDLHALEGSQEETGEAGLDAALTEIEVRRAVELAKLEMSKRARSDVHRG